MVENDAVFTCAVVLTGSIATGKSTVAKLLTLWDYVIIDADKIAHIILNEEAKQVATLFGNDVLKNDEIDRQALGTIVFNDTEKRQKLESLLHPLIYTRVLEHSKREALKNKLYFIDIPLYFESQRYRMIKKSLLVYTPEALQLQRLIQRDNIQIKDAQNRISLQLGIEEKKKQASYILDNSQSIETLEKKCKIILKTIEGECICS